MSRGGGPAFDRRRFNAPEDARPVLPPLPPVGSDGAEVAVKSKGKGKAKGKGRDDGRGDGDVRPIYMKMGLVTEANGSCYIETGDTKLICAVYGPKPVPRSAPYSPSATLSVSVKFTPFAIPSVRLPPGPSCESPSLSSALHQALAPSLRLDLLPRSSIDVFVTVLEYDGPPPLGLVPDGTTSVGLAAGVTACSAALASAGIEMCGLAIGISAALFPPSMAGIVSPGKTLLDPTRREVEGTEAFVGVAVMPALGTTTDVSVQTTGIRKGKDGKTWTWGGFSVDAVDAAVGKCRDVAALVHGVVIKALEEEEVKRAEEAAVEG